MNTLMLIFIGVILFVGLGKISDELISIDSHLSTIEFQIIKR
jgi:hypothetical protein